MASKRRNMFYEDKKAGDDGNKHAQFAILFENVKVVMNFSVVDIPRGIRSMFPFLAEPLKDQYVTKQCTSVGRWEGRAGSGGGGGGGSVPRGGQEGPGGGGSGGGHGTGSPPGGGGPTAAGSPGWTNYTPCYSREMLQLYRKLYSGSPDLAQRKLDIAERTRVLEIVGFSVSLAALLLSLAIFCHFRLKMASECRNMFYQNKKQETTEFTILL
ncbi:hypothetical protein AAG570_005106 [Ranatra chinensis]|uniref:Uncharacterized protein n=1 Tax=Ranatra chinensis TaxID=642074 RepID=A0ABD0XZG5_9HEMI